MVEDDRNCLDISVQLLATIGLLKSVNNKMLQNHIKHCLQDDSKIENKENEIAKLLKLLDKNL